jgi:hypothetical protein
MVLAKEYPKYSNRNLSQETEIFLKKSCRSVISPPQILQVIEFGPAPLFSHTGH